MEHMGLGNITEHNRWLSINLVGGIPTPLKKYEFVSWDDDIPNMMGKMENGGFRAYMFVCCLL